MKRRAALIALAAGSAAAATSAAGASVQPAAAADPEADLSTPAVIAFHQRRYSADQAAQIERRWKASLTTLRAVRTANVAPGAEPALVFQPLLPGVAVRPSRPLFRPSLPRAPRIPADPQAVAQSPIWQQHQWLRRREISSRKLTELYLDRLERLGPRLLAATALRKDAALAEATVADEELARGVDRGYLHGIPWGAKDILAVRGLPTAWGNSVWADRVFDFDATVVDRLRTAGAVLVAKLATGELAQGDRWFRGMTRNPWKPDTGSSGSSAGPGSATAAGLVGFSIGSETQGSIVSPSVRNGVVGLRPTYGRVPRTGAMVLAWSMDKLGPMCRSVLDTALVLQAIHGPDGVDPAAAQIPLQVDGRSRLRGLRAGIDRRAFDTLERTPERQAVYQRVLNELESLGVELLPLELPEPRGIFDRLWSIILPVESAASFAGSLENADLDQLVNQGDGGWPNTFRTGSLVSAVDYLRAMQLRRLLQQEMQRILELLDFFVTVPSAGPGLLYTNMTGHPSLVLRAGMLEGAPVSVELTGHLFDEGTILRVGMTLERKLGVGALWPDAEALPPEPPQPARTG